MDGQEKLGSVVTVCITGAVIALFLSARSCDRHEEVQRTEREKSQHAMIAACISAGNAPHECERLVGK